MKSLGVLLFSMLLVLGFTSTALATLINITDASFELPGLADGAYNSSPPTGWAVTGGASGSVGVYNPPAGVLQPSAGSQYVYLNSGGNVLGQWTSETIQAGSTYTLYVDVASRVASQNYQVNLVAGSPGNPSGNWHTIASLTGSGTLDNWATKMLSYTADASNVGWILGIQLVNAAATQVASQVDFDNVRLDQSAAAAPVPEPGTLLLLGTGLVGLAGLGRKKFRKM